MEPQLAAPIQGRDMVENVTTGAPLCGDVSEASGASFVSECTKGETVPTFSHFLSTANRLLVSLLKFSWVLQIQYSLPITWTQSFANRQGP